MSETIRQTLEYEPGMQVDIDTILKNNGIMQAESGVVYVTCKVYKHKVIDGDYFVHERSGIKYKFVGGKMEQI